MTNKLTEQEELQALMLRLALLEKECSYCGGLGDYLTYEGEAIKPCDACHGSGKVPLLEGVREKCAGRWRHVHDNGPQGWVHDSKYPCICSESRGWVPAYRTPADVWKWFEVVGDIGGPGLSIEPLTAKEAISVIAAIFEGELAFFRALAQSLGVKDA